MNELPLYRILGYNSLSIVLKSSKNINIFEKNIHISAKYFITNTTQTVDNTIDNQLEKLYNWFIYQTIGSILKNSDKLQIILKQIKNNQLGWSHPIFNLYKQQLNEHDDFVVNPFEVVEGVTTCKCGSKRTFTHPIQNRSCDESTSTKCMCMACGDSWIQSI
jgi:DNA-directed RNA polymerase subunit M/transcription elongation factor TFIIS